MSGYEVKAYDGWLQADLSYPERDEDGLSRTAVHVGLMHVRAADDLRIQYDFDRDGWSVQQASRFEWAEDEDIDRDWQEVAFVKAWAREEDTTGGGR